MKYQELIQNINQRNFSPVYFFTGPETVIAAMMEKRLINAVISPGLEQLNVMSFSNDDINIADVTAICRQLPMMSEYRIIILREETGLMHSSDANIIENLCEYLEHPEPSTILIIYDRSPDKRKKLWKTISKTAAVVDYAKLTQPELEKWIARRLNQANKKTKRSVVEQFIENTMYLTNENQTIEMVDNELDKIINYLGGEEEITMSTLNETMQKSIDDNIYRMIDCIMDNNMDIALTMLNQFYLEGESPFSIFGLILSQIRTLFQVKLCAEKRMPAADIAKHLSRPPFVIKRMLNSVKYYKKNQFIDLIEKAGQLDLDMKTGAIDPQLGVTLYILEMQKINKAR